MLKRKISQLLLRLGFEVKFNEFFESLFISFRGIQLAEFSLGQLKDGFKAFREAYLYRVGVKGEDGREDVNIDGSKSLEAGAENLFFYYLNWGLYSDSELELNTTKPNIT